MRSLLRNLQLPLQVRDPALHEVHIVQEDPSALLRVLVQDCLGRRLLSLAHGDDGEGAVLRRVLVLVCISLKLLGRRVTGEKHKEDGGLLRALRHHRSHAEGLLVRVLGAHGLLNIDLQGAAHSVWPHCPDDQELPKEGHLAPLAWHLRPLDLIYGIPRLPLVAVLLHVFWQAGKHWQGGEGGEGTPLSLVHPPRQVVSDWGRIGGLNSFAEGVILLRINLIAPKLQLEREQTGEDELVAVKKASPCVVIHGVRAGVDQQNEPLLQLFRGDLLVLFLLLLIFIPSRRAPLAGNYLLRALLCRDSILHAFTL
mmetsp:Transcript_32484/g.77089  ORF Transcript_32484/g.77089 Transcript_32484/m.77089 type:complete len:311 (+) Transcript_32484:1882-2814(+)